MLSRFFKTGPGEYGEGDRFLGLTVPQVRGVAKRYRGMPATALVPLLRSPFHEERLLALVMWVERAKRGSEIEHEKLAKLYLRHRRHINNWDLVDVSAEHVLGHYLRDRDRAILYDLALSRTLWDRRIAIITTFHFIRRGDFGDTLRLSELLLADRHDLMHKAVGWMLREVGKRDVAELQRFLDRHAPVMPRTMLRYSLERLPPKRRAHYMGAKP